MGGGIFALRRWNATWRTALRLKESHRAINGDDGRPFEDGRKHACGGIGRGESSHCEDPAPTVGIAGRSLRCITTDHHLRPHGHQRERRMGG